MCVVTAPVYLVTSETLVIPRISCYTISCTSDLVQVETVYIMHNKAYMLFTTQARLCLDISALLRVNGWVRFSGRLSILV